MNFQKWELFSGSPGRFNMNGQRDCFRDDLRSYKLISYNPIMQERHFCQVECKNFSVIQRNEFPNEISLNLYFSAGTASLCQGG